MLIVIRVIDPDGELRQVMSVPVDIDLGREIAYNQDTSRVYRVEVSMATENHVASNVLPPGLLL